jgi:CHAT domain-containing protein
MKSLITHASLLLILLQLSGTLNTLPVQAQTTVHPQLNALDQENLTAAVPLIEQGWEKEYEDYFKTNFSDNLMTVKNIAATLGKIASQTQKKPAILYIISRPQQL